MPVQDTIAREFPRTIFKTLGGRRSDTENNGANQFPKVAEWTKPNFSNSGSPATNLNEAITTAIDPSLDFNGPTDS
ncbi:MAG TPA: hypothetical protein VJU86_23100 [Pyrinomonadaceae bacterium]|nr:hypothetical protein [Pyrinomonadaceae bacterium]